MKETKTHPSLLPYLLPEQGKIHLRLQPAESPNPLPASSPFLQADNLDPLARIFRAAFVTDFGSVLKKINLLIQRDRVDLSSDQGTGLTNHAVDQYWQQAMTVQQDRYPEHALFFSTQVGSGNRLLPFSSLLYCVLQKTFFESSCPFCGQQLQLMQDDSRLKASGLHPYSTSRQRYLYCPKCLQQEKEEVWYTLERTADDPSTVRDCRQLFADIGNPAPEVNPKHFPCLDCQHHDSCHGPGQAVHEHIFILAFYPFYLLMSECNSLDGFHFLRLTMPGRNSGIERQESVAAARDVPTEDINSPQAHDRDICTILQDLDAKWHLQSQEEPALRTPAPQDTVIKKSSLTDTLPMEHGADEDDLSLETVIIKSPVSRQQPPKNNETLQTETVLLSKNVSPAPQPPLHTDGQATKDNTAAAEDELAETVIIRPGDKV